MSFKTAIAGMLVIGVVLSTRWAESAVLGAEAQRSPNVVLIMADDK
jgi:hypothetical protein